MPRPLCDSHSQSCGALPRSAAIHLRLQLSLVRLDERLDLRPCLEDHLPLISIERDRELLPHTVETHCTLLRYLSTKRCHDLLLLWRCLCDSHSTFDLEPSAVVLLLVTLTPTSTQLTQAVHSPRRWGHVRPLSVRNLPIDELINDGYPEIILGTWITDPVLLLAFLLCLVHRGWHSTSPLCDSHTSRTSPNPG